MTEKELDRHFYSKKMLSEKPRQASTYVRCLRKACHRNRERSCRDLLHGGSFLEMSKGKRYKSREHVGFAKRGPSQDDVWWEAYHRIWVGGPQTYRREERGKEKKHGDGYLQVSLVDVKKGANMFFLHG